MSRYYVRLRNDSGETHVDETITSFMMLVILGTTAGVLGGAVATFFGVVLWNSIEEVPEDDDSPESDASQSS
tara:strand:- start:773 stop:988 length:216 start_codon:yes stop_codon:yes gene_type:complete